MQSADLDRIVEIERALFVSPWRVDHFAEELVTDQHDTSAPRRLTRVNEVARHEGRVVAYACAWAVIDEFRINNFAVAPDAQGCGIGRWFLRGLLRRARTLECCRAELEVRPSNVRALALYEGEGFVEIARRKNYYTEEGEDAIVMELDL